MMNGSITVPSVTRNRAGDGALFTSSKCPAGEGLEQTCELPFGFVWTPLQAPSETAVPPTVLELGEELPPVMCRTCLSYLNMYATLEGNTWTCPICEEDNVAPAEAADGVFAPLLASPSFEFRQRLSETVSSTTVVLVMDAHLPKADAHAVGSMIQELLPTIGGPIQLGLVVFGKNVSLYQLGVESVFASADVVCGHEGVTKDFVEKRCFLKTIESADDFSSLQKSLTAQYGRLAPGDEDKENKGIGRMEMLRQKKEARLKGESDGETPVQSPWTAAQSKASAAYPVRSTGEALHCAIELASNRGATGRVFLFTNGCPNYGDGSVVELMDDDDDVEKPTPKVDPLELSRAQQYYDAMARSAFADGVGVDVLCTGAGELGLPAYQSMAEPSSGYVLAHETYGKSLQHNMAFILKHTFMTGAEGSEVSSDGCVLDIRTEQCINATHLVGPGEYVSGEKGTLPNEKSAFKACQDIASKAGLNTRRLPSMDVLNRTLTRIRVGRYDPLSTFSVLLRVNKLFEESEDEIPFVYFQFTVRYLTRDGTTLVTRVTTHRLPTAKNVKDFVEALDPDVVPVLLGKEAVYRSMFGREVDDAVVNSYDAEELEELAYDAQRDLDATIQCVAEASRLLAFDNGSSGVDLTEEGGVKAAGKPANTAFPPELGDAIRKLYYLRRGPLLSPGPIQSMDDRAELRALFMRLPLEDCMSMMGMSLWTTGAVNGSATLAMEMVPAETLTLWDNCVLAADDHQRLFVWSGKATVGPEYNAIRERFEAFLIERARQRFPLPKVHVLNESDSMSRRFTSLLAPAHGDPVELQIESFPSLALMSPEEQEQLRGKFAFYDQEVDPSFNTWFAQVTSPTNASNEAGISLCE